MRHLAPVAAAAAALALLAACGTSTSGSRGPVAAPAVSHTAAAPSCRAQYESWKHGAAEAAGDRLTGALRAVQAAGKAGDLLRLRAALGKTGRAAKHLAATPPPRCADPAGYFGQMLAALRAAGDNARAAGGLAGIILAKAALKAVPGIEKKLSAELDRTVGKRR